MREYGDQQKPLEEMKSHLLQIQDRTLKFSEYRKNKKEYQDSLKKEKENLIKNGSLEKIMFDDSKSLTIKKNQ